MSLNALSGPFPETVIFDLDGTLVDTAPDLAAALNHALTRANRPTVSMAKVRHTVGRGPRALIASALGQSPADSSEVSGLVAHFLEYYDANVAVMSKPFPGAESAARRLASRGHRLGICTNKPEELSIKLMTALALRDLFPVILGADSRPYRKPDPRHLLDAIAGVGGKAENAVLIGDSDTDVKTARAAQVPVIAVAFGYTETPARALGADGVIDDFDELERAFAALPRLDLTRR